MSDKTKNSIDVTAAPGGEKTRAAKAEPAAEVAKAPDAPDAPVEQLSEAPTVTHSQEFLVGPRASVDGLDDDANAAAVRQAVLQVGLWPVGDVKRKRGTKLHADGVSTIVTYQVKVVAAEELPDSVTGPEVTSEDGDAKTAANAGETPKSAK